MMVVVVVGGLCVVWDFAAAAAMSCNICVPVCVC